MMRACFLMFSSKTRSPLLEGKMQLTLLCLKSQRGVRSASVAWGFLQWLFASSCKFNDIDRMHSRLRFFGIFSRKVLTCISGVIVALGSSLLPLHYMLVHVRIRHCRSLLPPSVNGSLDRTRVPHFTTYVWTIPGRRASWHCAPFPGRSQPGQPQCLRDMQCLLDMQRRWQHWNPDRCQKLGEVKLMG